MHIIATVDFSEQLKKGQRYELPESDARMLIAAGLATADAAAPPVAEPQRPARTRQYQRRDLQAATSTT